MNDHTQIRKLAKDDLERVFELLNELNEHQLKYEFFKKNYDARVNDENSYYICATINGKIVGVLIAEFQLKLHDFKRRIFVDNLIVDERYRGRGIGKKMLQELVNHARANNCGSIELTSRLENERAHRFYERNNFVKNACKFKQKIF